MPSCLTCGCTLHGTPRTWEVTCVVCGEKKYPMSVENPAPFTCRLCLATPPEKREAARGAALRGRATKAARRATASVEAPAPAGQANT